MDAHFEEEHQKDIYLELQNFVNTYPDSVDIAWRFARCCFKHSNDIIDQTVKETILLEGTEFVTTFYAYLRARST